MRHGCGHENIVRGAVDGEHIMSVQSPLRETDSSGLQEENHLQIPVGFYLIHEDEVYQLSTIPGRRLFPGRTLHPHA